MDGRTPHPTETEQQPCDGIVASDTHSAAVQASTPASVINHDDERPLADAPIISSYIRQQALEDGTLVDVDRNLLVEFGITFPVALTRAVWEECVTVPESLAGCQDEQGRLFDILHMFRLAARNCQNDVLLFKVIMQQAPSEDLPLPITLKALVGPGDQGEGVITILMPHED
jgi:hypothetical protein